MVLITVSGFPENFGKSMLCSAHCCSMPVTTIMEKTVNQSDYIFRRAESPEDAGRLRELFTEVFYPEEVGAFAEILFHHLPGRDYRYWFIAEEKATSVIAAAFTLIPWVWEMDGISLKAAELGVVGTREGHRKKGLMERLNREFDGTLREEGYDIAGIQGIPGFYNRFGFHYAIPLENSIHVPFHVVEDGSSGGPYTFREGGLDDIPFFIGEDRVFRNRHCLASFRGEEQWRYLLTHSKKTEYGSEYWIMENNSREERYYFRVPLMGFGDGLIVSEVSEAITAEAVGAMLAFCREKAMERGKPSIRLTLPDTSPAAHVALAMGAVRGDCYGWQIKIPDAMMFIRKISPLLEKRLRSGPFREMTGTVRIDLYRQQIDILWEKGLITAVRPGEGEAETVIAVPRDLFPALCLGYRTLKELNHSRPDISASTWKAALLAEALFPVTSSWINEQY